MVEWFNHRVSVKLLSVLILLTIGLSIISTPVNVSGQFEGDPIQTSEDCFNGFDDDADGFVDGDDVDCGTSQSTFEDCFNGFDDDGDSWIDGQDADCTAMTQPEPVPEEVCDNALDDDGDGSVDEDCAPPPPPPEEVCDNALDDDGDGSVDEDCAPPPEPEPVPEPEPAPAEECGDGLDNNQDGQIDEGCPATIQEELPQLPQEVLPPGQGTGTAPQELPQEVLPPGQGTGTAPQELPQQPPEVLSKVNDTPAEGPEPASLTCFTTEINSTICSTTQEPEPTSGEQNQPPVANAGDDQTVTGDSMVNLDASNSKDSDGNITSYFWSQTGEPSVTIVDADTPNPSFIAPLLPTTTDLVFDLTVVDDKGAYDTDSVDISVNASDAIEEPIENISIELNPVPEKIFFNDTYEFTGTLNGIDNASGRYIEIKDDDGSEKGGTIAFDDTDENGNFATEWYPGPEQLNYTIYASYEDSNGNMVKSESYDVEIEIPGTQLENIAIENITIANVSKPFIQINKNPWIQKTLNVYVVGDDNSRYIDTVQSAVDALSTALRDSTGNQEAWDFRLIRSEDVYKNPRTILAYPPNIMIILENKSCVRENGKELGNALDLLGIGDILDFRYLIRLYTGSSCQYPPSATVGETVYYATVHEMIHGLGIRHAWYEKGDLMCSAEPFGGKWRYTCQNEDGTDAEDYYKDYNTPSEFDIQALRFIYGDDGFELPNPDVERGDLFYCEPCEQFVKESESGNIPEKVKDVNKPTDRLPPTYSEKSTPSPKEQTLPSNGEKDEKDEIKTLPKSYSFISSWGTIGVNNGQFDESADVAVDSSNNTVYVTDINNARIQKFMDKGTFLKTWGEKGVTNGSFDHPGDIAVNDGFVYVSDINNNRIQKFDTKGKFITSWGNFGTDNGQFDHPGAIAVDSSEDILYVAVIGNHRVQKFTTDGKYLDSWGSEGKQNGQLDRPAGLAFDSATNRVFVVDTGNDRIQVFDKNGTYVDKWGSSGTGDGQFNRPTDVTVDAENKLVYVADSKNFRIQVFDNNGNFISKWGTKGEGKGQFLEPTGIAVNPAKNLVYVADKQGNEISMFSTSPVSAATLGGNATEYPECFSGTNPPPCILSDGTTAYSCDDPRHLKSDLEQCIYWNKSTGGYDLRMNLAGNDNNNHNRNSKNNIDDGGYACRFSDARVVESNKDLPVCDEKRIDNNDNNDDDNKKEKDNSDEFICDSDSSTSAPSCDDFKGPEEDFDVQGNVS